MPPSSAERPARAKIVEAHANGFRALRVHHGRSTSGPDAHAPTEGSLKAAVLALVKERDMARLLDRDPYVGDASTLLFFRHNRRPTSPVRWTSLLRPEYTGQGTPPPGAALP